MVRIYDRDGEVLGWTAAACATVRPFTLGYQQCVRPEGHAEESHRSQDGSEWTSLQCDPQPGDLIEGTIAGTHPRTVRVRIARVPWPINHRAHTVTDGAQMVVALLSNSIRVVAE